MLEYWQIEPPQYTYIHKQTFGHKITAILFCFDTCFEGRFTQHTSSKWRNTMCSYFLLKFQRDNEGDGLLSFLLCAPLTCTSGVGFLGLHSLKQPSSLQNQEQRWCCQVPEEMQAQTLEFLDKKNKTTTTF